ncbi:MAG: signal peptide peptidase SppA [Candidatus Babeliales bacterium]
MKQYLFLGLLFFSVVIRSDDFSWPLLMRDAALALKELRPEDKQYQKIITATAVGCALVPIAYRVMTHLRNMAKTQVGVIEIQGGIFSAEEYIKQLEEFKNNPSIQGLLLKIDSPGGSPGAAEAFHNELIIFKEQKPVVAIVENICASAAYYIASAADYIIANPSSIIGSIGVYMPLTLFDGNPQEFTLGLSGSIATVADQTVQAGEYKRVGNPFKPLTAKEQAYIQKHIDEAYDTFCSTVAHNRGLVLEERASWAEGQIFNGNRAVQMGLIDEVGSISNARVMLHNLITKKGIPVRSDIRFIRQQTLWAKLIDMIGLQQSTYQVANTVAAVQYQIHHRMKQHTTMQNMQTLS